MSGGGIAQTIGVLLALVLVVRGLRARNLPRQRLMWFAAAWVAIIVVLAIVLTAAGRG